jgi:hypothetical protein
MNTGGALSLATLRMAFPGFWKVALMSLLAGDTYGKTPYWMSLKAFKGLYYLISLGNIRRTFAGWKRRRFNIQDMGLLKGETIQEVK